MDAKQARTFQPIEKIKDEFSWLPQKAFDALENGTCWNGGRDDTEAGDWVPYYCDDCDSWHQDAYADYFEIIDGVLWHQVDSVDQDGNWDHDEGFIVWAPRDPEATYSQSYDEWLAGHEYRDWDKLQARWNEYYEWVADTGKDPLSALYIGHRFDDTWQIRCQVDQAQETVLLTGCRQKGTWDWITPAQSPREVIDYLSMGDTQYIGHDADIGFNEILEAVKLEPQKDGEPGVYIGFVEVKIQKQQDQLTAEIKAAAQKALKSK